MTYAEAAPFWGKNGIIKPNIPFEIGLVSVKSALIELKEGFRLVCPDGKKLKHFNVKIEFLRLENGVPTLTLLEGSFIERYDVPLKFTTDKNQLPNQLVMF